MNLYILKKLATPTLEEEIKSERIILGILLVSIILAAYSLCMAGIYLWDYWGKI